MGDLETVASALTHFAEAGFDGFGFSVVAYNDELPYGMQEVLPHLERLGMQQKVVCYRWRSMHVCRL